MREWFTGEDVRELVRAAPIVVVVLAILWAGRRGVWVWGPSARAVIARLEADRNDWRDLALALLKEHGITHATAPAPRASSSSRPAGDEDVR